MHCVPFEIKWVQGRLHYSKGYRETIQCCSISESFLPPGSVLRALFKGGSIWFALGKLCRVYGKGRN